MTTPEGERRSLAVEIVDAVHGYTYEFSSAPAAHLDDYDRVEGILRHKVGVLTVTPVSEPAQPTDWTVKDGRSNSSDEYEQLVDAVAALLREGSASGVLSHQWVATKAALIVAQLAHVHNVGPLEGNR